MRVEIVLVEGLRTTPKSGNELLRRRLERVQLGSDKTLRNVVEGIGGGMLTPTACRLQRRCGRPWD